MLSNTNLYKAAGISWTLLGFTRGLQAYDYSVKKRNKQQFYLHKVGYGIAGLCVYVAPTVFTPIVIYKELYRLEVNLRDLENEKNTDFYNELFI